MVLLDEPNPGHAPSRSNVDAAPDLSANRSAAFAHLRQLGNDLAYSRKPLLLDLSHLLEPKLGPGRDHRQQFVSWTARERQAVQLFPDADALGGGVYDRNLACQRLRPTLLHFRVLACETRAMIDDGLADP